jgi:hypothetical protein
MSKKNPVTIALQVKPSTSFERRYDTISAFLARRGCSSSTAAFSPLLAKSEGTYRRTPARTAASMMLSCPWLPACEMLLTTASWPLKAVASSFSSEKSLTLMTVEFGGKAAVEERREMIVTEKLWRVSAFRM